MVSKDEMRRESAVNAEKIIEQSPIDELKWLLHDIWDHNYERWIDDETMHGTVGSETVIKYGFTKNQLDWIIAVFNSLGVSKTQKEKTRIEIDVSVLKAISEYYQFPYGAFFLPKEQWEKHRGDTRLDVLLKEKELLDRIREILEED